MFDEIRLAKVRLAQHEPLESALVAADCPERTERLRSSIVVEWLICFNQGFAPECLTLPEVVGFQRQLREYVRKAAPLREREVVGSADV